MGSQATVMKNSMFLAVRMFLTMGISFYASRVVLQQLGVTDFGVYSVVGALTLVMSFFTISLTTALQRFMNVELGVSGGKNMERVFAACCVCVAIVAVLFWIVAEVAGVWMIDSVLSIPRGRETDARIVYQMTLVIATLEILRTPYNSLIIAHERMSFYAYNSIIEAFLKLMAVTLLAWVGGNKLLIYVGLLIVVAGGINCSYIWFCHRTFPTMKFSLKGDRELVKRISKFTGWNVLTSVGDIAWQQGSAMILNVFYGVALNATMGITNQVKTAVTSFTKSVQTAANPQLMKTCAGGKMAEFEMLFGRISRVSVFFVCFLGMPVFVNAEFLLSLWLTVVPPYCGTFVKLIVVFCAVDALVGPLWACMQASGRIAVYQIVTSLIWLLCLPLTYWAFRSGLPPFWVIIVLICNNTVLVGVRLWFARRTVGLSIRCYLRDVVGRIAATIVPALPFVVVAALMVEGEWLRFFVSSTVWCLCYGASVYLFGITHQERRGVKQRLGRYFKSFG